MITIHGLQRPGVDKDRWYGQRKKGGKGLMEIEGAYMAEINKLVKRTECKLIQIVRTYNTQIQSF